MECHMKQSVPMGSLLQRERNGGRAPATVQLAVDAQVVEEVLASSPQQAPNEPIAGVPTENKVAPEAVPTRQSTRSTRGVAPQRMTYEV